MHSILNTNLPENNSEVSRPQLVADYFARTYRTDDPESIACLARKNKGAWKQRFFYTVPFMDSYIKGQQIIPEVLASTWKDLYVSQNLHYRPARRTTTLRHLLTAFVDCDCYHVGLEDQEALKRALRICADNGIPEPSEATFSGRGLYPRWMLKGPRVRAWPENLVLWNLVQDALVKAFEPVGADPNAKDACRVLRPDGSINSRNGHNVHSRPISEQEYTLDQLSQALGVTLPARSNARHLKPVQRKLFNLAVEGQRRMRDIEGLCAYRGGFSEGYRNEAIFMYACCAILARLADELVWLDVLSLNQDFSPPLPPGEVQDCLLSAFQGNRETGRPYKFQSSTIAERLHVTPAEEKRHVTIISKQERQRRAAFTATAKRVQVAVEQHPGARQVDLAKATGHGQGTISKYLRILGRSRALFTATVKRVLVAFEKHPGARQVDLAEVTGLSQSTISRILRFLGLKTVLTSDKRGKESSENQRILRGNFDE
ncbi:hypothetical protein ES703_92910 [subsurface metagenome]